MADKESNKIENIVLHCQRMAYHKLNPLYGKKTRSDRDIGEAIIYIGIIEKINEEYDLTYASSELSEYSPLGECKGDFGNRPLDKDLNPV
jgi:hypothetical protein